MTRAFLIVDMQNDFMPGGALGVPGADELVPLLNALMARFPLVVVTQDWHPPDHVSFAANHPGKKPGEWVQVRGVEQVLWPVHCVQNTKGAALVAGLDQKPIAHMFHKGTDPWIDSYSAFFDNARAKSTGLDRYLREKQVTELFIAGVATDYCVLYSSIDAIDLGFSVTVIEDACRGINLEPEDVAEAFATMRQKGVHIFSSKDLFLK